MNMLIFSRSGRVEPPTHVFVLHFVVCAVGQVQTPTHIAKLVVESLRHMLFTFFSSFGSHTIGKDTVIQATLTPTRWPLHYLLRKARTRPNFRPSCPFANNRWGHLESNASATTKSTSKSKSNSTWNSKTNQMQNQNQNQFKGAMTIEVHLVWIPNKKVVLGRSPVGISTAVYPERKRVDSISPVTSKPRSLRVKHLKR